MTLINARGPHPSFISNWMTFGITSDRWSLRLLSVKGRKCGNWSRVSLSLGGCNDTFSHITESVFSPHLSCFPENKMSPTLGKLTSLGYLQRVTIYSPDGIIRNMNKVTFYKLCKFYFLSYMKK